MKLNKIDDLFFNSNNGSSHYEGRVFDALKFVEDKQLCDPVLWALFVDQFRFHTDSDKCWRGEYWGKMMRGACFTYAYTKNQALYDVLEYSVLDMLSVQEESGRISSFEVDKQFDGWDMWARKYVLLGMQYFLEINQNAALNERIISSMCRQVDYIMSKVGKGGKKILITYTTDAWEGLNSSSILEPIVRLYKLTGENKYLDFAKEIIETGGTQSFNIFETVLEGKVYPYEFPVQKAYEMISCFEGIIEYYRVTGEEKYKQMALNFFKLVADSDITVIGCSGTTEEIYDHSKINQFNPKYKEIMQETCVTVTWMKFCYQLLCLTGDSIYADQIEISMYNAFLGSVNLNENRSANGQIFTFDSYSPLLNNVRGRLVGGYRDIINKKFWWGCCVAIGAAGTGLIPKVAVMSGKEQIAVNLFFAGEYTTVMDGEKITLKFDTDYPRGNSVKITVYSDSNKEFTLSVRIPSWSALTKLKVNNETVNAESGRYANIKRKWKNNDVIEIDFDMRTKIIKASDLDPEADEESIRHIALQRGPIILARDSQFGEDVTSVVDVCEEDGCAILTEATAPIDCEQYYNVKCKNGKSFAVADYASCGQSWDKDKPITVWMAT